MRWCQGVEYPSCPGCKIPMTVPLLQMERVKEVIVCIVKCLKIDIKLLQQMINLMKKRCIPILGEMRALGMSLVAHLAIGDDIYYNDILPILPNDIHDIHENDIYFPILPKL